MTVPSVPHLPSLFDLLVVKKQNIPKERTCEDDEFILCSTSDNGPDQVMLRKIVNARLIDLPHVLYVPASCFKHQIHLIVKSSLLVTDAFLMVCNRKYGYFSGLAMCVNLWRESAMDIFRAAKGPGPTHPVTAVIL